MRSILHCESRLPDETAAPNVTNFGAHSVENTDRTLASVSFVASVAGDLGSRLPCQGSDVMVMAKTDARQGPQFATLRTRSVEEDFLQTMQSWELAHVVRDG